MNYDLYRASVGISNSDVIQTISEKFPKYSKAVNSMVNNGSSYGVCLLPEAEEALAERFGEGQGLGICESNHIRKRGKPNRTKPNRLCVYLTDDLYQSVMMIMKALGYERVQDFLMQTLVSMIETVKE